MEREEFGIVIGYGLDAAKRYPPKSDNCARGAGRVTHVARSRTRFARRADRDGRPEGVGGAVSARRGQGEGARKIIRKNGNCYVNSVLMCLSP